MRNRNGQILTLTNLNRYRTLNIRPESTFRGAHIFGYNKV